MKKLITLIITMALLVAACGPFPANSPAQVCAIRGEDPGCECGQYWEDMQWWLLWNQDIYNFQIALSCPYWYCEPCVGIFPEI